MPDNRRSVAPVAGPLFHRAVALQIDGSKRRKLLCLLAAYADAGEESPGMDDLNRRLRVGPPHAIDGLLDLLCKDGWLEVDWAGDGPPGARHGSGNRRNHYRLKLPDDG